MLCSRRTRLTEETLRFILQNLNKPERIIRADDAGMEIHLKPRIM